MMGVVITRIMCQSSAPFLTTLRVPQPANKAKANPGHAERKIFDSGRIPFCFLEESKGQNFEAIER